MKSRRGEAITPQSEEDFRELAAAFSSTQDRFALAWLEIQQEDSRLWQPLRTALEPLLEEGLRAARFGEAIARDLSEILGYKGERSYLLFFQNSAELWPGGGFVGALANLTLENGRIKALEFYDAYDFSQYYTKAGVWARNISLDPDFSQDAKGFMEIFERATGVQTDGAVGIDLRFAQGLLEITGPLELPDFEETVTAENFFEVTTAEVERISSQAQPRKRDSSKRSEKRSPQSFFRLSRANIRRWAGWPGTNYRATISFSTWEAPRRIRPWPRAGSAA